MSESTFTAVGTRPIRHDGVDKVTGRANYGADLSLPQALDAEFALTKTTMAHPDFAEGVRAMVVDKDRQPKWSPATIETVDSATIAAMFR